MAASKRTIGQRASTELRRLKKILAECRLPKEKMDLLLPALENVAWMKAKLDDARDFVGETDIVVRYNNGGGQDGIRENPAFKGYEALWKSYMSGLEKILESIPEEERAGAAEEAGTPKTVLELVRERHKKEA